MNSYYKLDKEKFQSEVVSAVKEVREFIAENKVLSKEDGDILFACLKFLIDVNGDVNQLMQRWNRTNLRIFSLLTRMEYKLEELEAKVDLVWKEEYLKAIRNDNKEYVSKAMADTSAEHQAAQQQTRPYRHLVKLLERTYKLSDSALRILEHLSNNLRAEYREALKGQPS